MASIELERVAHRYDAGRQQPSAPALAALDLTFRSGGSYALLGPSGCGKTTLLNIVSGLLTPSEGKVRIAGKDVTSAPPEVRNIAQVFQFPVIYDTMTVFDNLAFPLRNRRVPERELRVRVEQIATLLELSADLRRRASGLSADMKQRISLGRGLVRKDVAAILLDEPLTVIDPHVKGLLRRKLLEVHAELSVTLVYVTHDQTEALTLADEVVVMHEGAVLQVGTPEQLFERPEHTFVGHFIGSPGMNLLPLQLEGERVLVAERPLQLAEQMRLAARSARGAALVLGIRPEFVRLHGGGGERDDRLTGVVAEIEELGSTRVVFVEVGAQRIAIKLFDEEQAVTPGSTCQIELPAERTILYADGRAVG